MKKILALLLVVTSLISVSCTKRVEGILRENPNEITQKEALKLMDYFNGEFDKAQTLYQDGDKAGLKAYLKSPEWQLAERCHSKLLQVTPEIATNIRIAEMEFRFIEFVNGVIRMGIPLREVPEEF
ncbi:hypothetical protein [uncultured Duncaniella sp.]|uniref:hypothetical protein n=1 Tax=uncultured Duncaniella sp. TaxID=2768039 RepID=UPI0025ED4AF4|nr:hypothetical protein [uncultured Duncaniella sp.]